MKKKVIIAIIISSVALGLVYDISIFVKNRKSSVLLKKVDVKKKDDIKIVESSSVEPVVYYGHIDFKHLDAKERKKYFISTLLPSILLKNNEIIFNRELLLKSKKKLKLKKIEVTKIKSLKLEYKTEDIDYILENYNTIPPHMVLGQAALESGWGTSRFFIEGNNMFGVWSFNKNDNRIAASQKRGDQTIYVKKYFTILDSLNDYYRNINKNSVYNEFRVARKSNDENLVNYLDGYSEQGDEYVKRLKSIIFYNDLKKYDNYSLSYMVNKKKSREEK